MLQNAKATGFTVSRVIKGKPTRGVQLPQHTPTTLPPTHTHIRVKEVQLEQIVSCIANTSLAMTPVNKRCYEISKGAIAKRTKMIH